MKWLRQFAVPMTLAARGIPSRASTSVVVVFGVAIVVAVFISALALAVGFEESARRSGHADRVIILRNGTNTEAASSLSQDDLVRILNAPGIRSEAPRGKLLSAEALEFVAMPDKSTGRNVFVTLRGVGTQGLPLRPEVRLVAGRMFNPGAREVIVGVGALRRLNGLSLGTSLTLPQGEWRVVGAFDSKGDSHESELLTDAQTLLSAYRRHTFNSVTAVLETPEAFGPLRTALASDPTLLVEPIRENDYFAQTSRPIATLLRAIAFGIGGIMIFGASFGAITAMYAVTKARSGEIATLRAIGFTAGGAIASVLLESLILSSAGALVGTALAFAAFDGANVSTMAGGAPSQVAFVMQVTPGTIAIAVAAACIIGLVGGLLPAARAGRQTVAVALRG
jgi:putative ABC transport system permease protein